MTAQLVEAESGNGEADLLHSHRMRALADAVLRADQRKLARL